MYEVLVCITIKLLRPPVTVARNGGGAGWMSRVVEPGGEPGSCSVGRFFCYCFACVLNVSVFSAPWCWLVIRLSGDRSGKGGQDGQAVQRDEDHQH